MNNKTLEILSNEDFFKIAEEDLIEVGYYTDIDHLNDSDSFMLLQKTYKKREISEFGEPSIIQYLNGFILSKIWIKKGRINQTNGKPAEILYDDEGVIDKNWYINGRCINDEISFICLKYNKDRNDISESDIAEIKSIFHIK